MKIRNGFVSNSSSSSFVFLGFIPKVGDLNDDIEEVVEQGGFVYLGDGDYEGAIGKIIADNDGSFPGNSYSLEDINRWSTEISEFFKIDKSKIKIYTGTRMC